MPTILRTSMMPLVLGAISLACAPSSSSSAAPSAEAPGAAQASTAETPARGEDEQGSAGEGSTAAGEVGGALALAREGALEQLSFAPPEQLVFCRWYAEPERGDYLWVRLATDPAEDGDAGPRFDIDLCRVSERSSGSYAPMPAGQHGSHCAAEPGFAVWWHEGEAAVNSGPTPDPSKCELELEFDAAAQRASGSFRCAGLSAAAHGEGEGETTAPAPSAALPGAVTGSFACDVERVQPRK